MKVIRTEYRRSLKNNYMILFFDEEFAEAAKKYKFEFGMLASNQIPGLMRLKVNHQEKTGSIEYDITSRQSLSRILELKQICSDDVKKIIIGLAKITSGMARYLLSDRGISADPDHIYLDTESMALSLCYVPGLEQDFSAKLPKLLSCILSKIDHNDHEAVVLTYSLYQESMKENYIIDDLLKIINMPVIKEERKEKADKVLDKKDASSGEEGRLSEMDISGKKLKDNLSGKAESESFSFKNLFFKKKDEKNIKNREKTKERENLKDEVKENERDISMKAAEENTWLEYFSKEERFNQGKAGDASPLHSHTVLLSENHPYQEAKYSLKSLDKSMQDIEISHFPFIIGKQERVCDYVLQSEGVSRLHLRLDKDEEEGFIVTDLNSLNGTRLEGRLLANEESCAIQRGDVLEIAGLKYLFT